MISMLVEMIQLVKDYLLYVLIGPHAEEVMPYVNEFLSNESISLAVIQAKIMDKYGKWLPKYSIKVALTNLVSKGIVIQTKDEKGIWLYKLSNILIVRK